MTKKILVTGSAGFIGYHLSELLLSNGYQVFGYDGLTDYYDVNLKKRRHDNLLRNERFSCKIGMLEDFEVLSAWCEECKPDVIVHLAAQAGVRYSLENPRAYINANIVGTFNVMECARELEVEHLLMASTSSVYGANTEMPFTEKEKADTQITLYAATKKANESMAHSYAHLWNLPTTMFRFFTVYGPWGRPDMALFKFTKGILDGEPIDIYNNGQMHRDFTYVVDLVQGIEKLIETPPQRVQSIEEIPEWDSLSPVAPFRVVNIGNSSKIKLLDFIDTLEKELGVEANRNYLEMQKGDVPATWADANLLKQLTGFQAQTDVKEGIKSFVSWYRKYYKN